MPDIPITQSNDGTAEVSDPYYTERPLVWSPPQSLEYYYYDSDRVPRGGIPRTWRQLLAGANGWINPNGEQSDAEYLAEFEQAYGPCSTVRLVELAERYADTHRLTTSAEDTKGIGGEVIFILLMLGVWREHPQAELARKALVRFLESPELLERMLSAISLSHLRDERAIPMLLDLLTDGLPEPNFGDAEPPTDEHGKQRFWQTFDEFGLFREEIPAILKRWDVRSAIPALRHALMVTVHIETTEARRDPQWWSFGHWRDYQWALINALGWLGAFGALTGIEPPEENFWCGAIHVDAQTGISTPLRKGDPKTYLAQVWQVGLCWAAMARRYTEAGRHGTIREAEVRPEPERLLAEQFGLDEQERLAALEAFGLFNLDLRLE